MGKGQSGMCIVIVSTSNYQCVLYSVDCTLYRAQNLLDKQDVIIPVPLMA